MNRTGRWVLLGLLIAAGVLNYADRQIIAVLKPLLEREWGWSDQDYGVLASIFQFSAAAAYLGAGWFVDKVGLRWGNPVAVGVWSLAAMAHTVVRSFGQFVAARVALGASEAIYTPAAVKTVAAYYPPHERAITLGALNAANNLGAIVTPLVIPWLALTFGWRAAFLVLGGLGLAWAVAWFPLAFRRFERPTPEAAARAAPAPRVSWREALSDRRTWAIMGAKAFSDQVWWFLLFWAPDLFHREFHLGLAQLGAPLAIIYACAAVGSLSGGYISDRLMDLGLSLDRARKLTLLGCALLVAPVPLIVAVHSYWLAVALLGLTLAAHQGFSTNIFALITDITPARRVGTVTSLGALSGNLAGMSVLAAAGFVLSHGGGYLPFLLLIACAYLLALGWIQLLQPRLVPADPMEASGG